MAARLKLRPGTGRAPCRKSIQREGRTALEKAIGIFVAGIGGVFIGMGLLYLTIRITSLVADKLASKKEAK